LGGDWIEEERSFLIRGGGRISWQKGKRRSGQFKRKGKRTFEAALLRRSSHRAAQEERRTNAIFHDRGGSVSLEAQAGGGKRFGGYAISEGNGAAILWLKEKKKKLRFHPREKKGLLTALKKERAESGRAAGSGSTGHQVSITTRGKKKQKLSFARVGGEKNLPYPFN